MGFLHANHKNITTGLLISIVLSLVFALGSLYIIMEWSLPAHCNSNGAHSRYEKGMAVKSFLLSTVLIYSLFRYGDTIILFEPFPKEQYFTNIFLCYFYVIF